MQIPFLLYFSLTHSLSLSLSLSISLTEKQSEGQGGGGLTEWFLQSLKIFLKIWKKVAALPICSLSVKKLLLLHHHVHSVSSLCFGHHHHQGFATHNLSLSLSLSYSPPLSLSFILKLSLIYGYIWFRHFTPYVVLRVHSNFSFLSKLIFYFYSPPFVRWSSNFQTVQLRLSAKAKKGNAQETETVSSS